MPRKKKQSRSGWGAIRTLRSGRYQASYVVDGERYLGTETFDSIEVAREYLAQVRTDIARGVWISPAEAKARREAAKRERERKDRTFGAFATEWLERRAVGAGTRKPLRPTSLDTYRRRIEGTLAEFHDVLLAEIDYTMVADWQAARLRTGKASTTAAGYKLLSSILEDAVKRGLISENPCQVDGASSTRTGRKVAPPTDEELAVLVEEMPKRYRALVLIAAWAGTRYGETTELRRKDVSVTEHQVEERNAKGRVTGTRIARLVRLDISRGVVHVAKEGTLVGPVKTDAGVREVYLPEFMTDVVLTHLKDHVGRFPDSLLFPAPNHPGRQLKQGTCWRYFNRARIAAGRPEMPFHALRHFSVSKFAGTGAPMAEQMARHGHRTPQMSLRYQHPDGKAPMYAMRLAQ